MEKAVEKSALDIYINLSNIQSNTQRLRLLSSLATHFISQDVKENRIAEPDIVVGIELTGIPLSTLVAENMGKSLSIMRHAGRGEKQPKGESWIVNRAFADPSGKRAIIIDDVITSGVTVAEVIRSLRLIRTEVEAVYVIFDKKGSDRLDGVLVRPLVSVLPLKTG